MLLLHVYYHFHVLPMKHHLIILIIRQLVLKRSFYYPLILMSYFILQIYHLISEMKAIYSHIRVCPYSSEHQLYCDLELETDVIKIMANSRNHLELAHIWQEWHNKVGPPIKNKFMRYVEIANQASKNNGKLHNYLERQYYFIFKKVTLMLVRKYVASMKIPISKTSCSTLGKAYSLCIKNFLHMLDENCCNSTDQMLCDQKDPSLLICSEIYGRKTGVTFLI